MKRNCIYVPLVFALLIGLISVLPQSAYATKPMTEQEILSKMEEVEKKYPNGTVFVKEPTTAGSSCFAFMREFFYKLYGEPLPKGWDLKTAKLWTPLSSVKEVGHVGSSKGYTLEELKELLALAKPGDVLVAASSSYNHGMIIRSAAADGSSINVNDANSDWKNGIRINAYWSATGLRKNKPLAVTLYRYVNYSECEHSYETLKSVSGDYSHAAVCKKCGYVFHVEETKSYGTYVAIEGGKSICTAPYEDGRTDTKTIKDREYSIAAYTINAYGNRWYKVVDGYWIYSDWLQPKSEGRTNIQLSDLTTPGTLKQGSGSHISGTITSSKSPLKMVYAKIVRADGANTGIDAYARNIGNLSFSVYNSDVDSGLTFGKLAPGEYYIYYEATAEDGTKETESTSTFKVIGSDNLSSVHYTVNFDPNGGTVSEKVRTVAAGEAVGTLPIPSRESVSSDDFTTNYTFKGWSIGRDDGRTINSDTIVNADTTYYALWQETISHVSYGNYSVHLDANGGTVSQSTISIYAKPPCVLGLLPTPSRTGYSFTGWYTEKFGGDKTNEYTNVSSNMTLYAHWDTLYGSNVEPTKSWGEWSEWTDTPVYEDSTRQVQTRELVAPGKVEYRYGRYVDPSGNHNCWCETYFRKIGYSPILQYSEWSTTKYSKNDRGWTCGSCDGSHIGASSTSADGRSWWAEYELPNGSYYWQETRTVPGGSTTQYRYRDLKYCMVEGGSS